MAVTESSPEELRRWQHVRPQDVATQTPNDVLALLRTEIGGLSSQEAAVRLQVAGMSTFKLRKNWRSGVGRVAVVVRPLLLPLWVGALLAFVIDRERTGYALLVTAALNTFVAAWQERKVEAATEALQDALPSFARVVRNDREEHIMTSMLVPGDVLVLRPNDMVPADARLIQSDNLHITNPILRGDDVVAHKNERPVFVDEIEGVGFSNILYAGSQIVSGHGRAVVFATGLRTSFGKIAALTHEAQEEPSPLLWAFNRLGNVVLIVGIVGAAIGYIYVTEILGLPVTSGLLVAVLFLTAAVPTGLMPGITLTLVEGARRLRERNAVFRRLSNVETLGATTVICADKTGTLTQNEMTVRELWIADGILSVSGVGYQPRGEWQLEHAPIDSAAAAKLTGPLFRAAVLCSTARLLPPDTFRPHWHILGDPDEAALIVAAAKLGIKAHDLHESVPQLAVLNSDRMLALDGVIVQERNQIIAYLKGTPSDIVARCTHIATSSGDRVLTDRDRQQAKRTLQRFQRDAMRIIAFARVSATRADVHEAQIERVAHDLTLLGIAAVVDPPREEVAAALRTLHAAQIRTLMLTSDDTLSATSLARRCALVQSSKPQVISGPELETLDDAALKQQLRSGDMVLARLSPQQKVRVVQTLERLGDVVLVTGGAASDVPALKAAYTGIAMGASGTNAATAAADLVLRDDNFATIAEAIAEGRAVEQRVRRLVALNLATTVVKVVALIATLAAGLPLLLTVSQQLLIDFLAGLLPGLAIGAGRPDPRLMRRPPRPSGRPLLARKVYVLGYLWFGGLAVLLALGIVLAYLRGVPELDARDVFASNLQTYDARIGTELGTYGLIATSLYVVVSVAALLGAAVIRRSAAPNDRGPLLLLLGLIGLSFVLLVGIVVIDELHQYIALTNIPTWGWIAAAAAVVICALLERIRQRLDPIFKPEPATAAGATIANVPSTKS